MEETKKAILKDTVRYTGANYVAQGVGLVTGVVIRRALGPMLMGIWELVSIVLRYGEYSELGVSGVAQRDIPFYRGQGREEEAKRLGNLMFGFMVTACLAVGAGLWLFSIWASRRFSPEMILGLRVGSLILLFTTFYSFGVVLLRAHKRFDVLSQLVVANAVLFLILAAVLTSRYKLHGLYAAVLLSLAFGCAFAFARGGLRLSFAWDGPRIRSLIGTGLPILLSGVGLFTLMSVDRFVIAKSLGVERLGLYTIAILGLTTVYEFPKSFGIVLFPWIQERFGAAERDLAAVKDYFVKPLKLLSWVMPVWIGLFYFAVPVLVRLVLPKYVAGIPSFKILILGAYFLALAYPSQILLLTLNRQRETLAIVLGSAGVSLAVNLWLVPQWGLAGAAVGSSAAFLFYYFVIQLAAVRHLLGIGRTFRLFCRSLVPFGGLVGALALIERLIAKG